MKTAKEMVSEIVELSKAVCSRYDDMIKQNQQMLAETTQYVEMALWAMQSSAEDIRKLTTEWGI